MTYKESKFSIERKSSYWCDCAQVTMSRPLWPRRCDFTDKLLWWRPAVRGTTSYYMRSGIWRGDVRWADPKALAEFKLRWA